MSIAELPVVQTPLAEFVVETPAPVLPAPLYDDEMNLASYEAKLTLIRDYVRGVVLRFATGFFLCGNGGISKSHTVLNEVEKLGADYKLFNSRMSGRGLFQALAEYPNTTHILEDMERIVGDKDSQGVLRSALWSQRGEDGKLKRVVTWSTARGIESICFTGGIIMLSNRPLADLPELRAIRTRISHLHLMANDQEIASLMRRIACKGFQHGEQAMTADECQMVCEYLIAESQTKLAHLDLRLLDNSFRDFLLWKAVHTTSHGMTLVTTRLDGRKEDSVSTPRDRQLDEDLRCLEVVLSQFPSTMTAQIEWCRMRNKSRASFFRYKRALEEGIVARNG
jgi:hypothetical protein